QQNHTVLAHSRSNYNSIAQSLGVQFFSDPDDLCEEHPDVILLSTSIISAKEVLKSLPFCRLRRSTLFVDVLSVKEYPRNVFLQILPMEFDILCTYPMFGPESGRESWNGLSFMYEKVWVGNDKTRVKRVERLLNIFEREGRRMVEMSCSEHDKLAAKSQFVMHTVGRVLEKLRLKSTSIDTKGYQTLLGLVSTTAADSFDLYCGLFMCNKNAAEQIEMLELAFDSLRNELFGHFHGVLRQQLFEDNRVLPAPPYERNRD
ncbi:Prephenate dehydrogenase, nucleotide-binding domain, partial [Dillenia turbinata]